jgi:hypothetical protein
LHNEELHNLYSSPNIIRMIKSRRMRWAEHVARMGEKRNAYRILVGKPEGRRPLGRPKRRWVDNIKIDLRETGPHLWSSGQSFWLQIQRSRGRFPALPHFLRSKGLERGPLSLLRKIEELLE